MNFKNNFKSLKKTIGALTFATGAAIAQAQSTGVVQGVQQDVNNISALTPLLNTKQRINGVDVGIRATHSEEFGNTVEASVVARTDAIIKDSALKMAVAGSPNERKLYVKGAVKVNDRTAVSLTGQRLEQNQNFNFASGAEKTWVGENSFGAGIKHNKSESGLKSFGSDLYYSKSGNEKLPNIEFSQKNSDSIERLIDNRNIAGFTTTGLNVNAQFGNDTTTLGVTVGSQRTQANTLGNTPSVTRTVGGLDLTYHPTNREKYYIKATQPTGSDTIGTVGFERSNVWSQGDNMRVSYSSDKAIGINYTIPLERGVSNHNPGKIFTAVPQIDVKAMVQQDDAWLTRRVNARVDETAQPTRLVKVFTNSLPAGITIDADGNVIIKNNGNVLSVRYNSTNSTLTSQEAGMTNEGFKIFTKNLKKGKDTIIVTTDTTEFNVQVEVGSVVITGITIIDNGLERILFAPSTNPVLTAQLLTKDQLASSVKCKAIAGINCEYSLLKQSTAGAFVVTPSGDIQVANTTLPAGTYTVDVAVKMKTIYGNFSAVNTKTITIGAALVDTPEKVTLPTPTVLTNTATNSTITFAGGSVTDADAASGFNYNVSYIVKDASGNVVNANALTPNKPYTWIMQYDTWNKTTNTLTVNKQTLPQSFTTPAAGVDAPTVVTLSAGNITTSSILAACKITDADGASGVCSLRTSGGTLIETWAMGSDKAITGLVAGQGYTLEIKGTSTFNNPNLSKTVIAKDQKVNFTTAALIAPTVSLGSTETITLGSTLTPHLLSTNSPGEVTYNSNNPSAVTVNSSSGAVIIVGVGTATITAFQAANGNYTAASATYDINVNPVPNTAPTVTLTGPASMILTQGDIYTEQGATWSDAQDGAGAATVSGTVNTAVPGTYTITYSKTDAGGLTATPVTRTVTVNAPVVVAPVNAAGPTIANPTIVNPGVDLVSTNVWNATTDWDFTISGISASDPEGLGSYTIVSQLFGTLASGTGALPSSINISAAQNAGKFNQTDVITITSTDLGSPAKPNSKMITIKYIY